MSCYENFINLKAACDTTAPTSGLYIEDLPGLNVVNLAAVAGPHAQSAIDMVKDANRKAFNRLSSDLQSHLLTAWGNKAIEAVANLKYADDFNDADPGTVGMRIKWTRTAMSRLRINRLYFKSESAVTNLVITITDGITSTTKTISGGAGDEIDIDMDYASTKGSIAVTFDNSLAMPYKGNLTGHSNLACSSCTQGAKRIAFYGIDATGNNTSTTYGLLADVSLECDFDRAVCMAMHTLRIEMMYLIGHILLEEFIATQRINWIAISSKEWAQEKSAEWENRYVYKLKENSRTITNYLQQIDPTCLICKTITYAYQAG